MSALRKSDKISRHSHGVVERRLTGQTCTERGEITALPSNPEYLMRPKEGKKAAHTPSTLAKA